MSFKLVFKVSPISASVLLILREGPSVEEDGKDGGRRWRRWRKKMEDMSKEGGEEERRDEKKEKGAKEGEGEAPGWI